MATPTVTLRPMTEDEYTSFTTNLWEDFAQTVANNTGITPEEATAEAARQHKDLLPQEYHTPGHKFWRVVNEAGEPVGDLWVHLRENHHAFIYDIEMLASQRGKGYGEATMLAMEEALKPEGVTEIALNVFGDNAVAMNLYKKLGYLVIATGMRKPL